MKTKVTKILCILQSIIHDYFALFFSIKYYIVKKYTIKQSILTQKNNNIIYTPISTAEPKKIIFFCLFFNQIVLYLPSPDSIEHSQHQQLHQSEVELIAFLQAAELEQILSFLRCLGRRSKVFCRLWIFFALRSSSIH